MSTDEGIAELEKDGIAGPGLPLYNRKREGGVQRIWDDEIPGVRAEAYDAGPDDQRPLVEDVFHGHAPR